MLSGVLPDEVLEVLGIVYVKIGEIEAIHPQDGIHRVVSLLMPQRPGLEVELGDRVQHRLIHSQPAIRGEDDIGDCRVVVLVGKRKDREVLRRAGKIVKIKYYAAAPFCISLSRC